MFFSKNHEQTILEIAQGDYIAITAESFLIDRQAGGVIEKESQILQTVPEVLHSTLRRKLSETNKRSYS